MPLHALLVVNLGKADRKERKAFADSLETDGWETVDDHDQVFKVEFDDSVTEKDAYKAVEEDVEDAVEAAGLKRVDVAALVGKKEPLEFYI